MPATRADDIIVGKLRAELDALAGQVREAGLEDVLARGTSPSALEALAIEGAARRLAGLAPRTARLSIDAQEMGKADTGRIRTLESSMARAARDGRPVEALGRMLELMGAMQALCANYGAARNEQKRREREKAKAEEERRGNPPISRPLPKQIPAYPKRAPARPPKH